MEKINIYNIKKMVEDTPNLGLHFTTFKYNNLTLIQGPNGILIFNKYLMVNYTKKPQNWQRQIQIALKSINTKDQIFPHHIKITLEQIKNCQHTQIYLNNFINKNLQHYEYKNLIKYFKIIGLNPNLYITYPF